jgi:hypothetical protein
MTTIKDYFDQDPPVMTARVDWHYEEDGKLTVITAKVAYDFEAGVRYWYFFIPTVDHPFNVAKKVIEFPETDKCVPQMIGDGIILKFVPTPNSEPVSTDSLTFTRKLIFYFDVVLVDQDREAIQALGRLFKFDVVLRDRNYAWKRSASENPLAFISHDSRDKDTLVRELAVNLAKLACPVWYDEFSLKVGDNLRESIERGLQVARKCILVLSPNFLGNSGWGRREFDAVFTKEIVEGVNNLILPVWHGVNAAQVYSYSPTVANRKALQSSIGTEKLAEELAAVLKAGPVIGYARHV